jgi:hypothetical protein
MWRQKHPLLLLLLLVLLKASGAWLLASHHRRRGPCHSSREDPVPEPKPRPAPTGFSFVEGGVYTNERDAIEAMGGDPFFLQEEDSDEDAWAMMEEEEGNENAYFDG